MKKLADSEFPVGSHLSKTDTTLKLTLDFATQSVKLYNMKHSESGNRKVLKQMKKCPDILAVRQTANGYMIMAKNGEQYLAHMSAKAFHPLRRWLKSNTSLKSLRF